MAVVSEFIDFKEEERGVFLLHHLFEPVTMSLKEVGKPLVEPKPHKYVIRTQQGGEACQLCLFTPEVAQSLARLGKIAPVGFQSVVPQGIVDVEDGDFLLLQLCSEEGVFVPVSLAGFIKLNVGKHIVPDEEVECGELRIGMPAAVLCRTFLVGPLLVAPTEAYGGRRELVGMMATSADDGSLVGNVEVAFEVFIVVDSSVAVDKQQQFALCLRSKEVAHLRSAELQALIVSLYDFVADVKGFGLLFQVGNQLGAVPPIDRNQNGYIHTQR